MLIHFVCRLCIPNSNIWCIEFDHGHSAVNGLAHIMYYIYWKNPYCSKFTLFKTRFLSLAHFYLLHKIGYATPWCLFYLQKTNDRHWYAIVGFSRPVSHICLLTVRQLINWTFNINNYQFSNARVVFKRCLKSENCDHFMKSRS